MTVSYRNKKFVKTLQFHVKIQDFRNADFSRETNVVISRKNS